MDDYSCGQEGSPVVVHIAADLKKPLTDDHVDKSLHCEEDAQGCSLCFSSFFSSIFAQSPLAFPKQSPEQRQPSLSICVVFSFSIFLNHWL